MARTGENIYKRKDGRWEARYIKFYTEEGKAKYGYLYAPSYNEVKQKLLSAIQENHTKSSTLKTNELRKNYSCWLNEWLLYIETQVKVSTLVRYQHSIRNHIEPALWKYPIEKISTSLMEQFIRHLLTNGRRDRKGGLSNKSTLDILLIVKQTFRYAQSHEVTTICNFSNIKIKSSHKEMRVLSKSEEKQLVGLLITELDRYSVGVLLALYTGIRIGELCALQGKYISLESKTIKIQQTVQRLKKTTDSSIIKTQLVISSPKSNYSIRTIPIPEFLCDFLSQFPTKSESYFLSGKHNKVIEPRTMQNHFKKYIYDCGISNANFHSLRHTFATRCVENGFDTKSFSEILGHSNVKITLDRYVHSSFEQKRLCMEKLKLET